MRYGKPGGMNAYTKYLGENIEKKYKNLISMGHYDTLVGVIYN